MELKVIFKLHYIYLLFIIISNCFRKIATCVKPIMRVLYLVADNQIMS